MLALTQSGGARPPRALLLTAVFLALVALGIFGILRFVESERARVMLDWQTRIGIIADSRAAAVSGWVDGHYGQLRKIAENSSVQPYLQELIAAGPNTRNLAQNDYLRIFLTVAADRAGFSGALKGADVPANVKRTGTAGIALLDKDANPLVATRAMPPFSGKLKAFLATVQPGKQAVLDIHEGAGGKPTIGFIVPVFTGGGGASQQIGWVLGVKEIGEELTDRLRQPGNIWRSAEGLLVRRVNNALEYISPRLKADYAAGRTVDFETPRLASGFAVRSPGGFGVYTDYNGDDVLVTGRLISGVPRSLLYKVDRIEALGSSDDRLTRLLVMFLLVIALIAVSVVMIWRHAANRRTEQALAENRALVEELDARSTLLRQVTDAQPSPIFIVDEDGTYRFANVAAAKGASMQLEAMPGRNARNVIGNIAANRILAGVHEAAAKGDSISRLDENGDGEEKEVRNTSFIPLASKFDGRAGVLVVEEDISAIVRAKERQERSVAGVLHLLISIIDRRDPSAFKHSEKVSAVAKEIAGEMGLEETQVKTVEMAGLLMNFGKALVPRRLLTKAGRLTEEEMNQVHDSTQRFIGLLEGLEFDGPVVEALRQVNENWDGSGHPEGLAGDRILIAAQIVVVANAFVAMISTRAWRQKMDIDQAAAEIARQADMKYQRRVTTALMNLLENRDARERWSDFAW